MVLIFHHSILCDHSPLLWTFMHFILGCFLLFFSIYIYKRRKMEEKCVLYYFSWIWNQGWPYYLYITCLCTLFSLDELILLHFTSLSFVVYVVWELFIVFDHMILILKSHAFDCKVLWNFKILASVRTVPKYSWTRTRSNPQGLEWT